EQLDQQSLCHYYVEKFLGEGTYGKVAKCLEMSTQKHVAIKIVKKDFEDAGEDEIKALIELSKIDADKYNLVKFVEWFHHNNHVCIVFDMLDQSLYDYLEKRGFRPLSLRTIRCLAWQLLVALSGLKKINMVHFDIKPDNIMLVDQNAEPLRLKLIDFGLAEKVEDLEMGIRIQNICFRAPEVMLGLPLDERLDMWTVGYVLGMLYAGFYFYPQDSEYNIIRALVKMFFTRTEENSTFNWKLDTPEQQFEKTGQKAQKVEEFMDLLKRMLEVDPNKRISPDEALQHPLFNPNELPVFIFDFDYIFYGQNCFDKHRGLTSAALEWHLDPMQLSKTLLFESSQFLFRLSQEHLKNSGSNEVKVLGSVMVVKTGGRGGWQSQSSKLKLG
uniref:Protein kinase domain-containing protein n=1 Tax=Oryzias melastigma TaxID=30732 RepID=A0A3B3D0N1_ORYME